MPIAIRTHASLILVVLAIAVTLGACTDSPTPTPTPTPLPPTATPVPPTPTPTLAPTPTATPTALPTAPALTPTPRPVAAFTLHIDSGTTWREAFDAFTPSEQDCIRAAVDGDTLERALETPILEEDEQDWAKPILSCVAPETVRAIIVSEIVAGGEQEGVAIGEAEQTCLWDLIATVDIAVLIDNYDVEDPAAADPAAAEAMEGMIACVFPSLIVSMLISEVIGESDVDQTLSEEEETCLREWLGGFGGALFSIDFDDLEDPAAAEAMGGMIACIPELFVSVLTVGILDESGVGRTQSAEEVACLEDLVGEVVADVDWAEFPAAGVEAFEGLGVLLGLGIFGCIPELLDLSPEEETPTPTPAPAPEQPHEAEGDPIVDRAALVALYNATGGPDWLERSHWLTDAPLGEWYGVTTDANGRVARLELGVNFLSGEIPPELNSDNQLLRTERPGSLRQPADRRDSA